MLKTILRREHKNHWEKRVAITPSAAASLKSEGYELAVESSPDRVYSDNDYRASNLTVVSSADDYQLVLGIKEPPVESILARQIHLCFSHTIKGQDYNMPLLQRFLDQKASLIDYELMTDERGVRTIAFGRYAGIAGAIDTLWLYAKILHDKGSESALSQMSQTWEYGAVAKAREQLQSIDVSADEKPMRIIILGSGKVAKGCVEVCQWLGLPEITAEAVRTGQYESNKSWFAVLHTEDMYARLDGSEFNKQEYYKAGKQQFRSRFKEYLGHCDVVLLTSFWTDDYPRHMELDDFAEYVDSLPAILGDISCDISGAFACTTKVTDIDNPVYMFDPSSQTVRDGLYPEGMAVMAIDNLPCELSQDASEHFSSVLSKHLPALMDLDLSIAFDDLTLSPEIKDSIIVFNGELTPSFQYLEQYL